MRPSTLRCLMAVVCLAVPRLPAQDVAAPAKSPLYFIPDYLPPAIYDRDPLTACFRVENTTASEAKLDFVFTSFNDAGEALKENTQSVTAAANTFTSFQGTLDSRLSVRMQFSLRNGKDVIGQLALRLLRDEAPWPATQLRAGRLELAEGGDILIPTITKRIKAKERAFLPMKWMLGTSEPGAEKKSARSIVFIPGRWLPEGEKSSPELQPLGPFALTGAPPILCAMNEILSRAPTALQALSGDAAPQTLVLCLPPEDLDAATDPHVFRMLVDGLLARAVKLPVKKVCIVPPFQFGAREKLVISLWNEVNLSAAAYGVVAVDPAEYLNETIWRVDPQVAGVYGKRPHTTGLKKIEQGLFNLIP